MKKLLLSTALCVAGSLLFAQEEKKFNDTAYLGAIELLSVRAGDKAPFTKTNLTKADIEKNNIGQDLPFLLNQTPSITVNSDAGNGVGYTGIRIRGIDVTRINVTLNGIPYNDAENQGTFFVDLPDIASSLSSIQLQRGVGTSSNGTGAFGATLSLSTNEFNPSAYGELQNSYGSFNTWKNTVKAGTGLIDGHFTVDARLSRISSDGYIDRAHSNLQSFYFSTAYINRSSSLRLNIFSGKEKTYQAWNGVPGALLQTDRTYNSSGTEKPSEPYDNETDNYTQTHYQLFFNQSLNKRWVFNTAFFLTRGLGYYENYKSAQAFQDYGLDNLAIGDSVLTATDLVRQKWLDNYFYGQILSLQYKKDKSILTIGGGWDIYKGNHHGNVIWAQQGFDKDYEYYNNDAKKTDINIYAKWQRNITERWQLFTDLQYRYVKHTMHGFDANPGLLINREFNFINPKAGITYNTNKWQLYFSYALANKEPNRDDFEATTQPRAERLHDFEFGIDNKSSHGNYGLNLFYMLYQNQLVLIGNINDVGAYTRTNIAHSYRAGVELHWQSIITKWLNTNTNITVSENKIRDFKELIDDFDNGGTKINTYRKTDISFSPVIVASGSINFVPVKNGEISLVSKYVSRQYMDNTSQKSRSLNDYYTLDARLSYTLEKKLFKSTTVIVQVNNVFSRKYEPNGYTFSYIDGGLTTENYYFPMAPLNAMIGLNIKL